MAETVKISENTWRIEDGMVRFFLLAGSEKALFIDSGVSGQDLFEIAKGLTALPLMLLNTHADGDHTAANGAFPECYMHPADEAQYRERFADGKIVPLQDGQIIDLGGRPLKIIHIPGHTAGSVAILDINARALYSGDSVQTHNIYMFGPRRSMADLVVSLKKLQAMQDAFDVIYPSHGQPQAGPELIGKLIEGAGEIMSGRAQGTDQELRGIPITLYSFPYAGFYCDRKAAQ